MRYAPCATDLAGHGTAWLGICHGSELPDACRRTLQQETLHERTPCRKSFLLSLGAPFKPTFSLSGR